MIKKTTKKAIKTVASKKVAKKVTKKSPVKKVTKQATKPVKKVATKPVKKYYKLTVKDEIHHGFKYKDGLNVDTVPFNKTGSCCEGGLYFSDAKNITRFLDGDMRWIREITIPKGEKHFVKDPCDAPPKWRSHSVICGPRKDLKKSSTWEWMLSEGIVINYSNELSSASETGNLEIVKYLLSLENVKFSPYDYSNALSESVYYGHIKIVKYLLSLDHVKFTENAYHRALDYGDIDMVKILSKFEKSKIIRECI